MKDLWNKIKHIRESLVMIKDKQAYKEDREWFKAAPQSWNRGKRLVWTPMDFIINFETDGTNEEGSEDWKCEDTMY